MVKYGEKEGGWCFGEARDGFGVGPWKSNRKEHNSFLGCFSFVICEMRVKFWDLFFKLQLEVIDMRGKIR